MTIKGTCFCGAVTYRVDGKLRDAASCHCSMCRKMFASQAAVFALLESEDFSWLSGEDLLTTYEQNKGQGIRFCSKCGSTLCGTHDGKVTWVTLGCIQGDLQIKLEKHVFVGSKAAWETIPEDVPHYDEWPDS